MNVPLCAVSVFAGSLDACDVCPFQQHKEDSNGESHLICVRHE